VKNRSSGVKKNKLTGLTFGVNIMDFFISIYFILLFLGKENIFFERGYGLVYPIFVGYNILAAIIYSICLLATLSKDFKVGLLNNAEVVTAIKQKMSFKKILSFIRNGALITTSLLIGRMFVAQITLFNMIIPYFFFNSLRKELQEKEEAEEAAEAKQKEEELKKYEEDLHKEFKNLK